jgi:hypothetical protein
LIVHVSDVAERDVLFLASITHNERVAFIPYFVDEIEYELFHDENAEHDHGSRDQ